MAFTKQDKYPIIVHWIGRGQFESSNNPSHHTTQVFMVSGDMTLEELKNWTAITPYGQSWVEIPVNHDSDQP